MRLAVGLGSMEIVENKLKNEGLWEKPKSDDLKRFKKIEERIF